MLEFTRERVIPEEVDADLWNEHFSRYALAARLSRGKRVLDIGCGTGYGTAELARAAARAVALDNSREALDYARLHYASENVDFLQATCKELPFRDRSFDLVIAFEVIEHLRGWRDFLSEMRRVLSDGAQCLISTPNKDYYTESRGPSGENPYHGHEFAVDEFRKELSSVFPHVSLLLQNHADGVLFQPTGSSSPPESRVENWTDRPEEAHFFLALCSHRTQATPGAVRYVPSAANVLREREHHIRKLAEEVALKNRAIDDLVQARDELMDLFAEQKDQLEERNRWAANLNQELERARTLIDNLEVEMREQARGYETKIDELEDDSRERTEWYEAKIAELERDCRERAEWAIRNEQLAEERTKWAVDLDQRVHALEDRLRLILSSRWIRLGNALGIGPRPRQDA